MHTDQHVVLCRAAAGPPFGAILGTRAAARTHRSLAVGAGDAEPRRALSVVGARVSVRTRAERGRVSAESPNARTEHSARIRDDTYRVADRTKIDRRALKPIALNKEPSGLDISQLSS